MYETYIQSGQKNASPNVVVQRKNVACVVTCHMITCGQKLLSLFARSLKFWNYVRWKLQRNSITIYGNYNSIVLTLSTNDYCSTIFDHVHEAQPKLDQLTLLNHVWTTFDWRFPHLTMLTYFLSILAMSALSKLNLLDRTHSRMHKTKPMRP